MYGRVKGDGFSYSVSDQVSQSVGQSVDQRVSWCDGWLSSLSVSPWVDGCVN